MSETRTNQQTPSDLPADVAAFIDAAIGRTIRPPATRRPVVPIRPDGVAGFNRPRRPAARVAFEDFALASLLVVLIAAAILTVVVGVQVAEAGRADDACRHTGSAIGLALCDPVPQRNGRP
jgi:hypothetical protein